MCIVAAAKVCLKRKSFVVYGCTAIGAGPVPRVKSRTFDLHALIPTLSNHPSFTVMDQGVRLNAHGKYVDIVAEWQLGMHGEPQSRYTMYRHIMSRDIFYAKDSREFREDLENDGTMVVKDDLLIPQDPATPLLEYKGSLDLDDIFIKEPPYHAYRPEDALVRDIFFVEVSAYETLRCNPHAGICDYRGCIVVDGYVEGIVLKKYKCTLMEAVDQGLQIDKNRVIDVITDAVAHLHSLGLVHNDLSPHNIMLDDNLNPVIIDMETCMPETTPAIYKYGTPQWSGNWWTSSLANDEVALERIRLYLNGLYHPERP